MGISVGVVHIWLEVGLHSDNRPDLPSHICHSRCTMSLKWSPSYLQALPQCIIYLQTCAYKRKQLNSTQEQDCAKCLGHPPILTTGQDFLHSWRHFFGLHRSLLTMAILVSLSCVLAAMVGTRAPRPSSATSPAAEVMAQVSTHHVDASVSGDYHVRNSKIWRASLS